MASKKFVERLEKLRKENDDIRITKRYIDIEQDTAFDIIHSIGDIIKYKSIVIELEVTTNMPIIPSSWNLIAIYDVDLNGYGKLRWKHNKAIDSFHDKQKSLDSFLLNFDDIKFNTVIKSVDVLRTRWYEKMMWER